MNIQRGDDRQYISNALPVNDEGAGFSIANDALNSGVSIMQQAQQSKLANFQVEASNKLQTLNDEVNTKWQQDPTNPLREKEFKDGANKVFSGYEINPLVQKQWGEIQNSLLNGYSTYNNEWQISQQKTNAQVDLSSALKQSIESVGLQNGDFNPSRVRLDFSNSYSAIKDAATPILGEVVTGELLKDFQHDFLATRLSKQIDDNPALALKLLGDESIKNDIGRLETIDGLKQAANVKLQNYNKEYALKNVADTIVSKGQVGKKIMQGTMKTSELLQVTKKMTPNERDIVWGMAGYKTSQRFRVDRETGSIKYIEEGDSSSEFNPSKLPTALKNNYLAGLEVRGANLLNFSPDEMKQVKEINKSKQGRADLTSGFLTMVKDYQDEVNAAYNGGLITKDDHNRLQGSYVDRVANYVSQNAKDLSSNSGFLWSNKTGYDYLKQQFQPQSGATKAQIEAAQGELGKATIAYYSSLEKISKQKGLNNVYDIQNLTKTSQREIYAQAQKEALIKTKAYTNNPSYWIQRDYPAQYGKINNALTKKDARAASAMFIQEIVKSPEMKYTEQNALTNQIIQRQIDVNRENTKQFVSKSYQKSKVASSLDARAKSIGVSMDDVNSTAKKHNMTPQQVLTRLELNKR